jgi:hypothetical protein
MSIYRTSATPLDSLSSSSVIVSQPPQIRWLDDLVGRMLHDALRCRDDGVPVDLMELSTDDDNLAQVVLFSGQLSDRCLLAS